MQFVHGKEDQQSTERDCVVQYLDLPLGHLPIFIPSLSFRQDDGDL
jgi:hypothetical protein